MGYSPWGREESDMTERLHFPFSLSCTGEGNGTPLQCSCLENPRDGGAWWAAVHAVAESDTTEQLHFIVCSVLFTNSVKYVNHGFPHSSVGEELPAMQETPVRFVGQEDPLEKGQATHSSILGLLLWLSW